MAAGHLLSGHPFITRIVQGTDSLDMLDVSRRIGPVSGEGGDANFSEAGGVLIMSDELDASSASLRNRSLVLIDDFEEKGQSRCVVEPA